MCDILNKEERAALIDRLKGVKKAIQKQLNKERSARRRNPHAPSIFIGKPGNTMTWEDALSAFQIKIGQLKQQDRERATAQKAQLERAYNKNQKGKTKKQLEKEMRLIEKAVEKTRNTTHTNLKAFSYLCSNNIAD